MSTTLLFAGLGTLLFHIVTKGKVPAFLGSSFAFLGGYATVAPMLKHGVPNTEMLPYACGGVFCAGLVYVVLAAFMRAFGPQRVMRYFPPIVTGPIIICIGLSLAPSAISNCRTNWLIALVALLTVIGFNIWGKGMMKIIPIILGVIASYAVAIATGAVDLSAISQQKLVALPPITLMKFDLSAIITIVPLALATMMEHIGDISAIGATTGRNYIADPGLHRTLLGDGLATCLAAAFGGPANTTYGENTGVLALTRIYDPKVIELAAVFAVILSEGGLRHPVHPGSHHRRHFPAALRHDLCGGRPEYCGEPGRLLPHPQHHHRRPHSGHRPGLHLQHTGRPHLQGGGLLHHPFRSGNCGADRHHCQRNSAGERVRVPRRKRFREGPVPDVQAVEHLRRAVPPTCRTRKTRSGRRECRPQKSSCIPADPVVY